jgi:uncharacterized protein YjiS (DUF1127 family)
MPRINDTASLDLAVCPVGRIGVELRSRLPKPWRAFRRWRRDANAVAALQALDARTLKDIGVERSEIESVVRGLGRDPSRVDRT